MKNKLINLKLSKNEQIENVASNTIHVACENKSWSRKCYAIETELKPCELWKNEKSETVQQNEEQIKLSKSQQI